jgi:hypothetical protein
MNPDIIETCSIKIAEAAAPDELDFAPLMAEAFIKGGKERDSLFSQKKECVLGGFGITEIITVFPLILQSMANSAQLLTQILSPVSAIKDIQDILSEIINRKETAPSNQSSTEVLPEEFCAGLKTLLETFTDEICKSGLPRKECEVIAYRTLMRLLDDPSSSILFVKAISKPEKAKS